MPRATSVVDPKQAARDCWTADPCGSPLAAGEPGTREYFERLVRARFEYAPWMREALGFAETAGLDVLDVGCGQGIDLAEYARAGARVSGVDLTPRHVELARAHLEALGLEVEVLEGDAEDLPFPDRRFDRVSSNGVLHHTPGVEAALREILRVLRPGGEARIILYNRRSLHYWLTQVAYHGILRGGLLREGSMAGVLSARVEWTRVGARPLVRVYSPVEVRCLLEQAGFRDVTVAVHHFRPEDTPPTWPLRRLRRGQAVLDAIGRVAGWYVVGRGRR